MATVDIDRLREIKTLPSLVKFLRDELDWPVEADEINDLTFDYAPEELGLDAKHAAKIKEIKQLRPLNSKQPWGIFWVNFEKKRLPMVVLRRILGNLIIKTRASARKADRPSWHLHDLLFISSYGEEEHRTISFAHFSEDLGTDKLPVLCVLGWDDQNSIMHLDRVANRLHSHFRWPSESEDIDAWRKRWSEAFTDRYREAIRSADELIPRLANLAANIRNRVRDVLDAETESGPMRRLFTAVQKILIHDMYEDAFADMYAQTVAYGLLSARFSQPADITPQNLVQLTAVSNPFLKNLLEDLFRLNRGKFHFDVDEVGINDVLDLLRNTNIEAIKAAFSDKNPAEDPVIRFYEGFLKQYAPEQRVKRGIFFTPRPVVSYIVRSVHELLQTEFGLEDGLASTATWAEMKNRFPDLTIPEATKPEDPFVCILDPATGTGTFLFECIEVIERTMKAKWCRELGKKRRNDPEILRRWQEYVPRHLLPRLYGYELMMAPYAIAHLKLGLKLGETGYRFHEGDRLHIYLTNSLEPPSQLADTRLADMFTHLATESQEVNDVKANKRFTVVLGNPPYSGESANKIQWIEQSVKEAYQRIDGVPIKEKGKKNWLLDDYVKFLRLSHMSVLRTGCGFVGHIINNAFQDNPTFRGLRLSLLRDFSKLEVLDLHGSGKRKDSVKEDEKDENVFDILQGVCVLVLTRPVPRREADHIARGDLWGSRECKYRLLLESRSADLVQEEVEPRSPQWFFISLDLTHEAEWAFYISLLDVFPVNGNGMISAKDRFAYAMTSNELQRALDIFLDQKLTDEEVSKRLNIKSNSMWSLHDGRLRLRREKDEAHFCRVAYRPFDTRCSLFHRDVIFNLRLPVTQHIIDGRNLVLLTTRMTKGDKWGHCFVTRMVSDCAFLSNQTSTNAFAFPLYRKVGSGELFSTTAEFRPNLSSQFIREIDSKLSCALTQTIADNMFCYIYAVFHSPTYRTRYAEFLKIDFPRVPLTSSLELFCSLAKLGGELVSLHLMESSKVDKPMTEWTGATPSGEIEKVAYANETVWIDKAQTEGFHAVPENIWNFPIGGYQVCQKWLKDRGPKKGNPGRRLSAADIAHYQKIVVALAETIRLMAEIDKVIEAHGGWPGAFASDVIPGK